jgi:HSP20 family protein
LIVHCDLPGVKKEDIQVDLNDGILTISGSKSEDFKEEKENFYRRERSYGSFKRSMSVPRNITEEQINAKFNNGVLEVCLPKPASQKSKNRITVS